VCAWISVGILQMEIQTHTRCLQDPIFVKIMMQNRQKENNVDNCFVLLLLSICLHAAFKSIEISRKQIIPEKNANFMENICGRKQ